MRDPDPVYVRFGSKADIARHLADVRFAAKSGHPIYAVNECTSLLQRRPAFEGRADLSVDFTRLESDV
jgi:hypothetical protein